jgi:lipid A 3-O-deacylase
MRLRLWGTWAPSNKRCFDSKKHFTFFSLGWILSCSLLTLLTIVPAFAQGQPADHPDSFTFYWENDAFGDTDQNYTNGLRLTWSKRYRSAGEPSEQNSGLNRLVDRLLFVNNPWSNLGVALSLGQSIFTPSDTKEKAPIANDRPYAAYLYAGLGLYAQQQERLNLFELDVGVVGPLALGEQLQNGTHRLIDSRIVQGWDNQLNNEPTIELIYETKWRVWNWQPGNGIGLDVIPHIGGRLGNVAIDLDTGSEFRIGWHLPDNFGTCPIQARCDTNFMAPGSLGRARSTFGIHLFAGLRGYYVLRDIFLDGNTFSSSLSVDKKPFVAEATAGIACHFKRVRLYYSYVWRSREFYQQDSSEIFGSIGVSFDY